jgi:hypothetical protein
MNGRDLDFVGVVRFGLEPIDVVGFLERVQSWPCMRTCSRTSPIVHASRIATSVAISRPTESGGYASSLSASARSSSLRSVSSSRDAYVGSSLRNRSGRPAPYR